MTFQIGQTLTSAQPEYAQAAEWCNANGATIIVQDGKYLIVAATVKEATYSELRAAEYPPMTDYLDGIVKGDQDQINKYIADCLAVKAKYPKE